MAKVGEGDARWIVSDRVDGTNVNSWHWQEKHLEERAHTELKSKFKGLQLIDADGLHLNAKEISDISGDVTVAQRKGKIMCYFDLKVTIKFAGSVDGADGAVDGKFVIPDVDHDSFREDFEIEVSTVDNCAANKAADAWARKEGRKVIRRTIIEYFEAIFDEHRVGTQLKAPAQSAPKAPQPATVAATSAVAPAAPVTKAATASPKPVKKEESPTKISWKMQWRCPIDDLWSVLTSADRASGYTRAPAKIEPKAGGTFEFLGGLISGYFVDVTHPTKMSMQWRLNSWPSGVFSSVVITLEKEEAGVTRMEFAQVGIPDGELERVKGGWQGNFWEPIQKLFGYGLEYL